LARVVLISTPSGAPFLVESFEQLFGIDGATREHGLRIFRQRFGGLPEEFMALPGDAPTAPAGAARA
jgi:hypothetical protein